MLKAMRRGIRAENILRFLESTAHPRMLKRADSGESVVPDNVRAQLQVWEDHNTRISCDRGVLFEWDPAECDLATFDMIMKHAVTSKGLLWFCKEYVDGQNFFAGRQSKCCSRLSFVQGGGCGRCQSANSHPAASCERCPITRGSSEGVDTRAPGTCGSTACLGTFTFGPTATPTCSVPRVKRRGASTTPHRVDHVSFSTDTDISFVKEPSRSANRHSEIHQWLLFLGTTALKEEVFLDMRFRSVRVDSLVFLLHLPRFRWCAQMLQLQIVPALCAHRNQDILLSASRVCRVPVRSHETSLPLRSVLLLPLIMASLSWNCDATVTDMWISFPPHSREYVGILEQIASTVDNVGM